MKQEVLKYKAVVIALTRSGHAPRAILARDRRFDHATEWYMRDQGERDLPLPHVGANRVVAVDDNGRLLRDTVSLDDFFAGVTPVEGTRMAIVLPEDASIEQTWAASRLSRKGDNRDVFRIKHAKLLPFEKWQVP